MRKHIFISFNEGYRDFERVRGLLSVIGCLDGYVTEGQVVRGLYGHTFDANDPKLGALRRMLQGAGIRWSEREEHVYTDSELRAFPLLNLIARRELEHGGPQLGTQYDLSSACPRCGCGAVQTSALMLGLSDLPKKGLLCAAAHGEKLVAEPLARALRDANLRALEMRQVRFYRNNEPLPWWQIITPHTMPRMSPQTRWVITNERDYVDEDGTVIRAMPPCPECRRDGRYNDQNTVPEIVYSRRDVDPDALPDFVQSWESYGVSHLEREDPTRSRFYEPQLLVNPKVLDVFRKLKVKHAEFLPVRFVD